MNALCWKDPIIRSICIFLFGAVAVSFSAPAQAWNAFNVQYLYGSNYELEPEQVDVLTLEWANGWAYGDNFAFVDITNFVQGDNTVYGEWAPRLSLSKITGKDFSVGPIQDVLLSGTIELGEGISNYLVGGAIDLAIPSFNFFPGQWISKGKTLSYRGPLGKSLWSGALISKLAGRGGTFQALSIGLVPRGNLEHLPIQNAIFMPNPNYCWIWAICSVSLDGCMPA